MNQIERTVLKIVAAQAPLSESAIGLQMPGVHNEILASCLRRLRERQQLQRSDAGLWSMKEEPPAAAAVETSVSVALAATMREPAMSQSATKTCGKCGSTEFTPTGKCRPCKKLQNAKYQSRKNGTALPPPSSVATKTKAKRVKSVPLQLHGERMVIVQFAIRIEDSAGTVHDLFLTGDVVKRLAIELQELV